MSDIAEGQDEVATEFARLAAEKTAGTPAVETPSGEPADTEQPVNPADAADAPAQPEAAEPAAKETPAPDIWANATPEQIAERDRLAAERDKHKASDFSQRGRLGAMQRRLNAYEASKAAPRAAPAAEDGQEPASPQGAATPSGADDALAAEIKRVTEEYPDVAGPLVKMLEAHRAEMAALEQRVRPVLDQGDEQEIARQYAILSERHPDYVEVARSPDFHGWLQDQPDAIRKLADSFDGRESSVVFTLFKTERDLAKGAGGAGAEPADPNPKPDLDARRREQLEGGRVVQNRAAPASEAGPEDVEGQFSYFAKERARKNAA